MAGQTQSGDKPLKVAFYAPALPESGVSNGIVTYTRIMRDALKALGHDVLVFTPDHIERADTIVVDLPKPGRVSRRIGMLLQRRRRDDFGAWNS